MATDEGRLLRIEEVEEITGLSHSTIYRKVKEGTFPPPVRVGKRAVRWREWEVREWVRSRPPATGDTPPEEPGSSS